MAETFPAYVWAIGSSCYSWSFTLLGDVQDVPSWSDYEKNGVGFNICVKISMYCMFIDCIEYKIIHHTKYMNNKKQGIITQNINKEQLKETQFIKVLTLYKSKLSKIKG